MSQIFAYHRKWIAASATGNGVKKRKTMIEIKPSILKKQRNIMWLIPKNDFQNQKTSGNSKTKPLQSP